MQAAQHTTARFQQLALPGTLFAAHETMCCDLQAAFMRRGPTDKLVATLRAALAPFEELRSRGAAGFSGQTSPENELLVHQVR